MLSQKHKEEEYQSFLSTHAGLFFGFGKRIIVLSKIRLGAELITDFIVMRDEFSAGIYFDLIEIENPYDLPYTREGQPSAKLTRAVQQIQNWKRWLSDNRSEAQILFPHSGVRVFRNPNFRFRIYIGNKNNSERWIEERNQYSQNLGIEIRSFDELSHRIKDRYFLDGLDSNSAQESWLSKEVRNQLETPFYSAYSDNSWRSVLKETRGIGGHFIASNAPTLLRYRVYSPLLKKFKQIHSKQAG